MILKNNNSVYLIFLRKSHQTPGEYVIYVERNNKIYLQLSQKNIFKFCNKAQKILKNEIIKFCLLFYVQRIFFDRLDLLINTDDKLKCIQIFVKIFLPAFIDLSVW
ncbi:hypothetical protein EDEG_01301 [Edhazardia aedis USNM 41457]|uniref:Uncharacterized protein n=1 Tax=Edhazardia aedis (strain USNM 41457) TaxID=1003232 RepID=J9DAF1_EDHAE|nr:hypothetical protein EDEG_01301 [Edhazardia aedis USNM 41457]|eukprot:EJW04484.1 hypothetical protein EDEG_01301 [Edhazardia aedis USNM 41457]